MHLTSTVYKCLLALTGLDIDKYEHLHPELESIYTFCVQSLGRYEMNELQVKDFQIQVINNIIVTKYMRELQADVNALLPIVTLYIPCKRSNMTYTCWHLFNSVESQWRMQSLQNLVAVETAGLAQAIKLSFSIVAQ
jgi:hypothetical protein